jgi:RNA polymerase sigma factor
MLGLLFTPLKKKRSLEEKILKIQQGDSNLRNELIHSYKPFIAKTASTVCNRYISESDDEFSIGMIAFNEAIDKYCSDKGNSLIAFAEIIIKRRVIDFLRSQSKQKESVFTSVFDEAGKDQSVLDELKSMRAFEKEQEAEKRKEEILRYNSFLREFGLSFQELSAVSPKHEDARQGAISIAKIVMNDEALKEILFTTKRLPIKQLESKVQVSRKTIERNRKYIIAICVLLSGEFLYLAQYIRGVTD